MTDCKKGVDTRQGNRSTTRSLGNYKHPGYIDSTPTWGCCKDDGGEMKYPRKNHLCVTGAV